MIDTRDEDELPETNDIGADPEADSIPTQVGRVTVFYNDQLMAYNRQDFQVSFQSTDILDPDYLSVNPPVSMDRNEDDGEMEVGLVLPERSIAVREKSIETETIPIHDDGEVTYEVPRERVWVPKNGEGFDFSIRVVTTPWEEICRQCWVHDESVEHYEDLREDSLAGVFLCGDCADNPEPEQWETEVTN